MDMKKLPLPLIIALVVGLVIGFFGGMEYKAYQVRTAIQEAFTTPTTSTTGTLLEEAKKENLQIIEKAIGDEVTLATLKFKVNKVEEKNTLNSTYGSPKVAKEGAKFVVMDVGFTNTTQGEFSFNPNDGFRLVDNKQREFTTYSDSIGAVDKYINYRELKPGVTEEGFLIYEVPTDAEHYSYVVRKAGTKELYKVVLK